MQADKADIVYHSYTAVLYSHTHILDDAAHIAVSYKLGRYYQ